MSTKGTFPLPFRHRSVGKEIKVSLRSLLELRLEEDRRVSQKLKCFI